MNYKETLDYLYHTLPMFSRLGSAAFKKDLTNIIILCDRLENPQEKLQTIHVGGTNGKGSVSHMLAAIYQVAGYKTGLYTSPHLYDFRERIKVNGVMIPENFVVGFVEKVKPLISEIEPSFFEITVAMAFEYFFAEKIDLAIIEVGLGGRLDSTNIITPELSIITNIGWDHMNMLGNSLEEIATEKAGIIKPGVPAVIGEKNNLTNEVFLKAGVLKKAPVYFAQEQFRVRDFKISLHHLELTVEDEKENFSGTYQLDLAGIYQAKNIIAVLKAASLLNKWPINKKHLLEAFRQVRSLTGLLGRWNVLRQDPLLILDVAHNQEGIEQLLLHLENLNYKNLHMVIGTVKDKEIERILDLLPKDAFYYFTQAHIPRAMAAEELQKKASCYLLKGKVYNDVNLAISDALVGAGKQDIIMVSGSIFLVAEVNEGKFSVL
ncbi:MAG: folylpolyglutamate synthase/dihydrofolate synthase family protein [Flavisolibacter sp.]